jgi:hypothetical protein
VEAQLDTERADATAIEALLQAEPDVVDVNRAAEAQLDAERADPLPSRPSCRRNWTSWT